MIYKTMFLFVVSTGNYKTPIYKRKSLIYKLRLNNRFVQIYLMLSGKENNTLLIFHMKIFFQKKRILTKARSIQMNADLEQHCRLEIRDLESKGLIQKSRSPWSCAAFYVNKNSEIERGTPTLVINYKPLNSALKWIRYPIPNKKDLLQKLHSAFIFSKFDMKSGFWQI
jgi:hypothetical protein